MVAIWAFSSRLWTGRDSARSDATTARTPRSSPRFKSTALAPAATLRTPSAKIAWARIVEVLVPSPTASPVRSAACRTICAPRFSTGSSRSISLAMVTPSSQTSGVPYFFSMSTDLDLGPSVTRTASANAFTPLSTFSRASDRNSTCLCAMTSPRSMRSMLDPLLYDSASSGSRQCNGGATPDHRDFTVLWPVRLPAAGIGAPH